MKLITKQRQKNTPLWRGILYSCLQKYYFFLAGAFFFAGMFLNPSQGLVYSVSPLTLYTLTLKD